MSREDQEMLLQALRSWGALDGDLQIQCQSDLRANSAATRAIPAAGSVAEPMPSDPVGLSEISSSRGSGATCRISRATISRPRCFSRSAAWT